MLKEALEIKLNAWAAEGRSGASGRGILVCDPGWTLAHARMMGIEKR